MKRLPSRAQVTGFILLPVILAMTLIAAIAYLLNRDNGINAEMVSKQKIIDRARYAAEAGLQAANAVMQSKNCVGPYSSPVTNSSFGGASYSAYATSANGNTTSLVSTGSYNGTTVTLKRENVYVYPDQTSANTNTYTLQPNADSYIDNGQIDTNYGFATVLKIEHDKRYPLLQFDLPTFLASSLLLSATLSLYANTANNARDKVSLYRLTRSWKETDVTWNTREVGAMPGGDFSPMAAASGPTSVNDHWAIFDVTDLTTAWLLRRYPNYGFILASGPTANYAEFVSRDGKDANDAPKMTFTYLLPCGP